MQQRRVGIGWGRCLVALALIGALAGCAHEAPPPPGGLKIRFEDKAAPGAFSVEAMALRDGLDGAAGMWAAVPGLKRPERAEVTNLGNGETVVVALYTGRGTTVRLSGQAADLLEIGNRPVRIRVTALRQAPRIDTTGGGF